MFEWLVAAELSHEKHLLETYEGLTGMQPDFVKLRAKFSDSIGGTGPWRLMPMTCISK
jgi:hypothetical protein